MSDRVGRSPLTWLGGLLGLYLLVPIGYFLYRLVDSHDRGFTAPGLFAALRTSAESATIATLVIAVLGIPLAYWLARSRSVFASVVGVLVQLPLALPPVMSGIVLIYVVGPYTRIGGFFNGGLVNTLTGVVLAQTFVAAPFLLVAARSAFAQVEPALYDLAATLGHRPLARFARVALPVAANGIRAGLLLTWLRAVGEYGATVLLAYHPYTLPVFTQVQFAASGLTTTEAPTALALGLAVVALALNQVRRPRGLRRRPKLPRPSAPGPGAATPVAFDLDIRLGEFRLRLAHTSASPRLAILGPSGSGKSVTLRALAGLYGADAGGVSYAGRPVGQVQTRNRHVGYVPQGHGLLPGRTVWQQVCFGVDADPALASWWLTSLGLDGLSARLPGELSGGQRQRVSLVQALARRPQLVLLDEPFSALDSPVRVELRNELRRLQRETGLSTVLVTHDPEEAALLADEIVVIADGRLLQAGSRQDVFTRPASAEVARLLGIANFGSGVIAEPGVLAAGGARFSVDLGELPIGGAVQWCVRPEHVRVGASGDALAVVEDVADIGTLTLLTVRLDDGPTLQVRTTDVLDLAVGDRCRVGLDRVTVWART